MENPKLGSGIGRMLSELLFPHNRQQLVRLLDGSFVGRNGIHQVVQIIFSNTQ